MSERDDYLNIRWISVYLTAYIENSPLEEGNMNEIRVHYMNRLILQTTEKRKQINLIPCECYICLSSRLVFIY